ncbi:HAMP domain-containing sensor histidine kinase, partial [Peptoniphilus harei]|uniref:sensor histidine kinase n=1 Tax=Peptoniphilus harei TaxID=54005 RepID=UPI0029134D9A
EIAFDLEDLAEEKNIKIISKLESKEIYTSDILLERVLYNLGKNAISYNRAGGDVVFDFSEDDENYFIYVKDTGPGIDEEEREKVFDLFYRLDESRNKKTGGYGIGLNLVKNIVEKLGGKVLISDNVNEDGEIIGTVFKVILPKK